MKTYRIYQVDAFTKAQFRGNPAGVVTNADGLTEKQMQEIARELNNSETAFILSPQSPDHDVWVRFFTPTVEVPSCGHATISAHYVRAVELNLPTCTVMQKIGAGILPVDIKRTNEDYKIVMTQGKIEFSKILPANTQDRIISALGLEPHDIDKRCSIQIVSTGHSKVMIGIEKRSILHTLNPNMIGLCELSKEIKCNGYFVFTLDSESGDILAHGRMFAPIIGIPEDPVTGNANGPLGAYIARHKIVNMSANKLTFRAKQGEAIGRPGIVDVEVELQNGEPAVVKVGGNAVIVYKTEIEL
jgi:PhzF family phenazine biosynthesis protein